MKQRHRFQSAQSGSAYIVVLLVLLLLTIFGLSLVVITHTERQIGSNEKDAGRNFFAAESGIAVTVAYLQESDTSPHEIVVGKRTRGGASASAKAPVGTGGVIFQDVVQTSQVVVVGSSNSNLGDISSNSGETQNRANFRFESNARRVSTLGANEVQLGQKRIELMIEMDPFELRAENIYTGALDYSGANALETPALGN